MALAYAGLRLLWEARPPSADLSPIGSDLVGLDGWAAVGLCLAAALAAGALVRPPAYGLRRQSTVVVASAASLAMVAISGPLLLLDVVGGIFPATGVGFYPLGAASRIGCLATGVLLGLAVTRAVQAGRVPCAECGRRGGVLTAPLLRTPRWGYAAAYVSMAGFLTRVLDQAVVGFDQSPMSVGPSLITFEVTAGLAGIVLPLALVHQWGRRWPRWVPVIDGRAVPRWLVLGPAVFTSGGVVIYFGVTFLQMVGERLAGRNPFPPSGGLELPEAFFWVAVPAYLVWGGGLAVAALCYFRTTRRQCGTCGH